jgi:hypothetical protein
MTLPLHLGLEHPSLVWIAGTGLLAFLAGLVVNLYRSRREDVPIDTVSGEE